MLIEDEIFEGNKLIAEFMECSVYITYENKTTGFKYYSVTGKMVEDFRNTGLQPYGHDDKMLFTNLRFHLSYDWLMRIVEKIHSHPDCPSGIFIDDLHKRCYHEKGEHMFEGDTTLEALYKIVVFSIKWLNKKINEDK